MKRRVRFEYGIIFINEKVYDDDTNQMVNRRIYTKNRKHAAYEHGNGNAVFCTLEDETGWSWFEEKIKEMQGLPCVYNNYLGKGYLGCFQS
jgi:hypothetical protein